MSQRPGQNPGRHSERGPAPSTAQPGPERGTHPTVEAPATPPHGNGRPEPDGAATARAARTGRKSRRLLLVVPILLVVGLAAAIFGYRYWYESTFFVMTDNAQVTGDLIQVGSLNAGRIVATRVEVGDRVGQGQELAVISVPQQVGSTPLGGAPIYGVTGTTDTTVPVDSPLDGIVVARMGYPGGTTAAGQPLFTVVDPRQIAVRANIEDDRIWRVQVGQPVEVHADALGRDFGGRVEAITPASAATFSLLPSQNTSANFTKVTQLVPVKISVDTRGAILPLGTSVEVKIQVRRPAGGLPWPL